MTTTRVVLALALAVVMSVPASADVAVGDSPQLRTRALDGATIDLAKLRGRLVLIDFWVGRSELNLRNEQKLLEIHRDFKDKGLEIIGICCDPRIAEAKSHIAKLQLPWRQIHEPEDWKGGLGAQWGVPRVNWDYLIAPDGKVIFVGDVSRVREEIEKALIDHPPVLVDPETVAKASKELDEVEALLAQKDRAAAVGKFARIPQEAGKNAEFAQRAGEIRTRIDAAADELLGEVDALVKAEQYAQAAQRLRELHQFLSALPATVPSRLRFNALLDDYNVKAALDDAQQRDEADAALTAARKLREDGDEVAAYRRFKTIATDYPRSPAGRAAADAVKSYENDSAFMSRMRERSAETKATAALALAASYRSAGQVEKAREKYQEIIKEFPETSFARKAQEELKRL